MDHLRQVQNAIDYIEDHLQSPEGDDLDIREIARRGGYSHWHFQRLFAATVGEGVKEYVRKRRLTLALKEITSTDRRLLDIALDHGFESQEAFSRAFKARFGATPGEARTDGVKSPASLEKPKITIDYIDHLYRGMSMEPKITEKEAFTIVGVGAPFISILSNQANNFQVIPALWGQYLARAQEIQHRRGWHDYGAVWCTGDSAERKDECFYVAGAEVTEAKELPSGLLAREVPAGKYAVFTHKGPLTNLAHTMSYIHGSWLPKSPYRYREEAPELELYGPRFSPNSPESELEILIPIQ